MAALGTGFFLHTSDCQSKYLTRAEFDEYVASEKSSLCGQGKVVRAPGGDVMPSATNVNHAVPAVAGGAHFHDGDRACADVGDAKPLHGRGNADFVRVPADGDEKADARPIVAIADANARLREIMGAVAGGFAQPAPAAAPNAFQSATPPNPFAGM